MTRARLNHRWQGHPLGAILEGHEAEAALAGGAAEQLDGPEASIASPTHRAALDEPVQIITTGAPDDRPDERDEG